MYRQPLLLKKRKENLPPTTPTPNQPHLSHSRGLLLWREKCGCGGNGEERVRNCGRGKQQKLSVDLKAIWYNDGRENLVETCRHSLRSTLADKHHQKALGMFMFRCAEARVAGFVLHSSRPTRRGGEPHNWVMLSLFQREDGWKILL